MAMTLASVAMLCLLTRLSTLCCCCLHCAPCLRGMSNCWTHKSPQGRLQLDCCLVCVVLLVCACYCMLQVCASAVCMVLLLCVVVWCCGAALCAAVYSGAVSGAVCSSAYYCCMSLLRCTIIFGIVSLGHQEYLYTAIIAMQRCKQWKSMTWSNIEPNKQIDEHVRLNSNVLSPKLTLVVLSAFHFSTMPL
eukprot:scpid68293/ scgid23275/ 